TPPSAPPEGRHKVAEESERTSSRVCLGKSHERGCDRVAGEHEGRGRACIALPRAGNRTRLGSQARPELRMEKRTGDEKKEPPYSAARRVKQGGVKVQEDGLTSPLMIQKP